MGHQPDGTREWTTFTRAPRDPGDRSVEVYVKADACYDVAARHRATELALNALSAELRSLAVANKRAGYKTEPAYYAALFPELDVGHNNSRSYAYLLQEWSTIEPTARKRARELEAGADAKAA